MANEKSLVHSPSALTGRVRECEKNPSVVTKKTAVATRRQPLCVHIKGTFRDHVLPARAHVTSRKLEQHGRCMKIYHMQICYDKTARIRRIPCATASSFKILNCLPSAPNSRVFETCGPPQNSREKRSSNCGFSGVALFGPTE